MKPIYIHETGPLVRFDGECLHIEDLNPQIKTKWRMSRKQMLGMAWRTFLTAFTVKSKG